MKSLKGWVRYVLVTIGIVLLTSFSVDATDALRGSQTALSLFAGSVTQSQCPKGTVQVQLSNKSLCVDIYENSTGPTCPVASPVNTLQTKENIDTYPCQAVSVEGAPVWTFVSYVQAKQLCAKKNMRLPSSLEWYEAGLGTPVSGVCNTNGSKSKTGMYAECVSSRGIHDVIGNVWEWVDEEINNGQYKRRKLPDEGYVNDVDSSGVATMTSINANELYDSDYFWSNNQGVRAMLRGGFYGAGSDAGLYSINTKITPSFQSAAIGFRCVQTL